MELFFYNKIGSIISIGDLPTTNIIEPQYIALQLCRMNRNIVTDNLFFIFLILLTISFWFSIWKLEKALANDSQ